MNPSIHFEASTPMAHTTLLKLEDAISQRHDFICVGELLLRYDPIHRILTVRDGFGAPVHSFRLWKKLTVRTTPDHMIIGSGDDRIILPWERDHA